MANSISSRIRKSGADIDIGSNRLPAAITGALTSALMGAGNSSKNTAKPASGTGSSGSSAAARQAAALAAQQAAQQAARDAAQNSYNNQMAALEKTYADRAALWQQNYQDALGRLEGDYQAGAAALDANTGRALQQAYVAYMLALRDLPAQLAALGVTGGSSESRLAGLRNDYGNARIELERQRSSDLAELLATLNAGRSEALGDYQQLMAEDASRRLAYQMELEQALAKALASLA